MQKTNLKRMPLRHEATKLHKEKIFDFFVKYIHEHIITKRYANNLFVLEPLWRKKQSMYKLKSTIS